MKILLITNTYPPEIGGAPHLIHELALSLKDRGHDVIVLTNYPCHNVKEIDSRYRRGLRMNEMWEGIAVRRIRIPSLPRDSRAARGLQHFIFGFWLGALTRAAGRSDVALVFSPPLPVPWLACLAERTLKIPVVVNIQDLFPREAVELGMLKNRYLVGIFEGMERQVHRMAAAITVHSPGNKEHVVHHGGSPDKVHIIYNWINTDRVRPGMRDNQFARENGLINRFVVSYAGTMGWAQDMGTIIASAALLRGNSDIHFLLVGDGVEKNKAIAESNELGLKNISWLPMQPYNVYPDILAASDVSLINLHPNLRTPAVPSKLLSIMAAARPVIANLPVESDARRIIADAGCGIYIDAGDGEALASAILKFASNSSMRNEMGRRGRMYVEEHFSREVCVNRMEAVLKNAIEAAR